MVLSTQDRIGRLRLVQQHQPAPGPARTTRAGRSSGDPATRLRLSRLLEDVDLHPSVLSPHAILIARRLQTAALADIRARPPLDWQRDLQRRLDELSRRAYRPARQPVPLMAESVLFADPSELLACLTRDVLSGVASQRWYWRQALDLASLAPASVISAHWSELAQWLPAAVAQLGLDATLSAISRLNQHQTSAVIHGLLRAWILPDDVFLVLAAAEPLPLAVESLHRPDRQLSGETRFDGVYDGAHDEAPWKPLIAPSVEQVLADLAPRQEYLAGLVWTLARRPSYARSRAFAAAASVWLHRRLTQQQPSPRGDHEALSSQQAEAPAALSIHDEQRRSTLAANVVAQRPAAEDAASRPAIAHSQQRVRGKHVDGSPSTDALPSANKLRETGVAAGPADQEAESSFEEVADGVQTEVAGVLFLVNLLRWLDLPDSWPDDPWMSGWSLLETLGRGLLDAAHETYAADALWPLLRMLDGRKVDELPGEGLATPVAYTLPTDWQRLISGPEAGVPDTPDGWSGEATLASLPDHIETMLSPAAAWWLRGTLPFARSLLSRSLGVSDADALAATLLLRSGRVQATRTHLDLYLPLDAASLAVRLSGLDLNPGWMPALGRIVQFHFV